MFRKNSDIITRIMKEEDGGFLGNPGPFMDLWSQTAKQVCDHRYKTQKSPLSTFR